LNSNYYKKFKLKFEIKRDDINIIKKRELLSIAYDKSDKNMKLKFFGKNYNFKMNTAIKIKSSKDKNNNDENVIESINKNG